jgi:hypothetical protein
MISLRENSRLGGPHALVPQLVQIAEAPFRWKP